VSSIVGVAVKGQCHEIFDYLVTLSNVYLVILLHTFFNSTPTTKLLCHTPRVHNRLEVRKKNFWHKKIFYAKVIFCIFSSLCEVFKPVTCSLIQKSFREKMLKQFLVAKMRERTFIVPTLYPQTQSTYIYRVQSSVWRFPKY
jgi:hypothetical protein